MDGEDNKEEKSRHVADIRMYHFSSNFPQLGIVCDTMCFFSLGLEIQ